MEPNNKDMLDRVAEVFRKYCVEGITADKEACMRVLMNSTAVATALVPRIGYERATSIVKTALKEDRTVLQVAEEQLGLPAEEIEKIFRECIENT